MTRSRTTAAATVLVADRRRAAREALTSALSAAGYDVCATCSDAAEAVSEAARLRPDVCLVDVDLPGGGLTTVRAIVTAHGSARVVVLASAVRHQELFAALRAGADGYVLKDIDPSQLPGEIDAVLDGRAALSRELTAGLIAEFRALSAAGARPSDPRRSNP